VPHSTMNIYVCVRGIDCASFYDGHVCACVRGIDFASFYDGHMCVLGVHDHRRMRHNLCP
jgi:hypothetical protein